MSGRRTIETGRVSLTVGEVTVLSDVAVGSILPPRYEPCDAAIDCLLSLM